MGDISGKEVLLLLFLTIVISVIGTVGNLHFIRISNFPSEISGKATTGIVQIHIPAFVAIDVTSADVDFGSGAITSTLDLSTEQVNPGTFNPCIEILGVYNNSAECRGIQIENTGSVFVKVTMRSDQDGDSLMMGDNITDEFRFATVEGNLSREVFNSCNVNGADGMELFPNNSSYSNNFMNWTNVSKNFNYVICHNLSYFPNSRAIVVEFNITVPSDEGSYSAGENRVALLEITAEQI